MFVAEETLRYGSGMASQAGLWVLALFLLGLSAMAYLTVREAGLHETKAIVRAWRRGRQSAIPARENLTAWSRAWLSLRMQLRDRAFQEAVDPILPETDPTFEARLRREIDKLVGKEVYHGQKEQL